MKKKNIIILIIIGVILLIGGLIGYQVYKDFKIENELKEELNELNELVNDDDVVKNASEVKEKLTNYISKGDYLRVEKAYKNYLLDALNYSITINDLTTDPRLTDILTIKNIESDGPDFIETTKYLEETDKSINENTTNLMALFDKNKLLSYLDTTNLDEYYIDFYKSVSFDEESDKIFKETREKLQTNLDDFNQIMNVYKDTINFLKNNKNNYVVKDNLIYFNSDDLLKQYNDLINGLN